MTIRNMTLWKMTFWKMTLWKITFKEIGQPTITQTMKYNRLDGARIVLW